MALLIPPQAPGTMPRGALRLFQALRCLSDEWTVWTQMAHAGDGRPDFLVLHDRTNRAFLLRALRTPLADISLGAPLAEECRSLRQFASGTIFGPLVPRIATHHNFDALSETHVTELEAHGIRFVGARALRGDGLEAALLRVVRPPLLGGWLQELRALFAPESQLDSSCAPPSCRMREEPADGHPLLLDLQQEFLAKRDLDLSEAQRRLVSDLDIRLLSGVAGSGKTLVLLHRAALLAQQFPQRGILVLTYNGALRAELRRRLERIDPEGRIACETFHDWCASMWKTQEKRTLLSGCQKQEIVEEIGRRQLGADSPFVARLGAELDWIHDNALETEAGYREADRSSRDLRLAEGQRDSVWKACVEWRARLERDRLDDAPHSVYRFCMALRRGLEPEMRYDHILVDEAQFFAPAWFEIIRRHLPTRGALYLAADPSQGFLRRGASWQAAGLDVLGHTDRLARGYRTTGSIHAFAWRFLSKRVSETTRRSEESRQHELARRPEPLLLPGAERQRRSAPARATRGSAGPCGAFGGALPPREEDIQPDLRQVKPGAPPILLLAPDPESQIRQAVEEIVSEIGRGLDPRHFLLLLCDPHPVDRAIELLNARIAGSASRAADAHGGNVVRVCSLDAATGLEAPVVYLLGASALLEAEQDSALSDQERDALRERNARRLYMGFTRAGHLLRIGWSGAVPEELSQALQA